MSSALSVDNVDALATNAVMAALSTDTGGATEAAMGAGCRTSGSEDRGK